MSKYEEERGDLILPSSAVLELRNLLTQTINEQRAQTFSSAEKIHARLNSPGGLEDRKTLGSLLRGKPVPPCYSVDDFIAKQLNFVEPVIKNRWGESDDNSRYYRQYEIKNLLVVRADPVKKTKAKLRSPRKKDFPLLLASKTWSWREGEFSISIDPEKRKLSWSVSRNNHAVEEAHSSKLGRVFFKALAQVKWTRGTGGVSSYSDEYGEDAGMEGHYDASHRSYYGPLGESQKPVFRLPRKRKIK